MQKLHRLVPLNKEELMVYPISNGVLETRSINKITHEPELSCLESIEIGDYVAVIYDRNVLYAIVKEHLEELDDITVNFLNPSASVI